MYESVKLSHLKSVFESKYDQKTFQSFVKEFFNEPNMLQASRKTGIWKEYNDHISSYSLIAKYVDGMNNELIILSVELKENQSLERARNMQRNFISKVLEQQGYDAAVVAFHVPNQEVWRLSFVRLDYTFNEKGLALDITPAKRYSYLVGEGEPNHTVKLQLFPIFNNDKENPLINSIEEAFSVEKVTKDFFEEYKNKYIELKKYLESDSSFINETHKLGFEVSKFAEQFSKKLLGQLAFLYFLQKKGWLGVRLLPKNRLLFESEYQKIYHSSDVVHQQTLKRVFEKRDNKRKAIAKRLVELSEHEAELFSDLFVGTEHEDKWGNGNKKFIFTLFQTCSNRETKNNFFNDFLQPLFYEALNKKRKNHYFPLFNCKIPFLNGGLFEPLEGYNWQDVNFNIPNELFSNGETKGRIADGIIDIFERYNFTINEDEPFEKEVAIDPEMLGKIFENLLDVENRKSSGAFYTPREIVHYMSQESLANYLANELSLPYKDIKEFILYGDLIKDVDRRSKVGFSKDLIIKESIYKNILTLDKALKNVRVADPAVGSGAFPLGMLSEIVRARNNITEYLVLLDKKGELKREIGENNIRKNRSPFKLKWNTIKNSIFAVDKEPSAVDIAKLRLWLSVVVDQEISEEIPEPHPLPNLDMNIMVGNSLVDNYEGIQLFDDSVLMKVRKSSGSETQNDLSLSEQLDLLVDYSDEILKEMFKLQDRYFDEEDDRRKKDLKDRIDSIRDELIEYKLERDNNKEGLKKYLGLKNKKEKPYFLWHLEFAKVFQEKGGFDILIGNPPYIGERKNKDVFTDVQKGSLNKYYLGRMDYFYFFFHLAFDLLKTKGVCSYITTNYFLTALGGKKLRTDIKNRTTIHEIINFNEGKVFDSAEGQHNLISILVKADIQRAASIKISNLTGNLNNEDVAQVLSSKTNKLVQNITVQQNDLWDGEENYLRLTGINNEENPINTILNKLKNSSTDLLGNICKPLIGLESSLDKIYVLSKDKVEEITQGNSNELEYVKPLFKNSDIKRYSANKDTDKYILYLHEKIENIELLKGIYSYLQDHEELIKNRKGANLRGAFKRGNWWVLNTPRLDMNFQDEKIVTPYRTRTQRFALSTTEWYASRDVYYIVKKKENISLKYILALLNSKLYYHWFYNRGKRKGNILELYAKPLKEVPIKEINIEEQEPFINIVDQIIYFKNRGQDTEKFEERIDRMIYELYNLSTEEIATVEHEFNKA